MKNITSFKIGNLVTSDLFIGLAEIQSIENGVAECVLTHGDSYMVKVESLTLYSDYRTTAERIRDKFDNLSEMPSLNMSDEYIEQMRRLVCGDEHFDRNVKTDTRGIVCI